MGGREADGGGAMDAGGRSELGRLQDAASSGGHRARDESPDVKKHQHKHNLKHRYEVMETLGKGTYGKVKKAVERASLKTVSVSLHHVCNTRHAEGDAVTFDPLW